MKIHIFDFHCQGNVFGFVAKIEEISNPHSKSLIHVFKANLRSEQLIINILLISDFNTKKRKYDKSSQIHLEQ